MAGSTDYQFVVIGAGASGSIVAATLANAGYRVLLLEAGQAVSPDDDHVWDPSRWFEVLATPSLEYGVKCAPQSKLGNRMLDMLQSKGLGGCQIHNAMVYVRGGRSTYDHWADVLGCTGWSYDDLIPFFDAVEQVVGISSPPPTAFSQAFVAAAGRLGLPYNPTYNGGGSEYGAVPFQFTVDAPAGEAGPRRTTAFAKYIAAAPPPGLTVMTGCVVRRLVDIAGDGPPTVEYRDADGAIITVTPSLEVILSAGAIFSPTILLRSGIGPGLVKNLPGVGQNFYDDLGIGIPVAPIVQIPGQEYGYLGIGAFATANGTDPGPTPGYGAVDIEVQISTSQLPGSPQIEYPISKFLPPLVLPYAVIGASSLHLKSRGSVKITSSDPDAQPVVDPQWLSDPADLDQVLASLRLVLALASDPELAAAGGWRPLALPTAGTGDPADLPIEYIEKVGTTVQHYVGSCAMGTDAATAVVDPTLCVYGVPGLRVIDASIAPTPVTGNTAGVSMVIGARGAAMVLASHATS